METAVEQRLDATASQIKRELREERIRYRGGDVSDGNRIELSFRSEQDRSQAFDIIRDRYNEFLLDESTEEDNYLLNLSLSEQEIQQIQDYAIEQNLTTIRNRVNELGVAEPLVQRQGADRIIVELPGVQDTAQAKRVLGATANLEFRLAARQDAPAASTETYPFRDEPGRTARLEREVIVTGENVANASQSFDENGMPQVNITLDGVGGDLMTRATRNSVGRGMAVLFIEFRTEMEQEVVDGEVVTREERVQETSIISWPRYSPPWAPASVLPGWTPSMKRQNWPCCCVPVLWQRPCTSSRSGPSDRALDSRTLMPALCRLSSASAWCWCSWRFSTGLSAWSPMLR